MIHCVVLVLKLAAFFYGVISWWLIKKFRNFKNYVYLNAVSANVFSFIVLSIGFNYIHTLKSWTIKSDWTQVLCISIIFHLFVYFKTVYNYWLVVICYMFYVDIVKVFNMDVQKKYLKSNLFAWAVPLLISVFVIIVILSESSQIQDKYPNVDFVLLFFVGSLVMPLMVNCLIYIRIVCSLLRCCNANEMTATDKWRRFYIVSLMFVMSDVIMVSGYILYFYFVSTNFSSETLIVFDIILYFLNSIALDVFLVVLKCNRELWREYFVNRSRLRSLEQTHRCRDNITMHEVSHRDLVEDGVTSS